MPPSRAIPTTTYRRPVSAAGIVGGTGGFTLLEMAVVITILAVLAGLVVGNQADISQDAEVSIARATMGHLREALVGTPNAPGYLNDVKHVPGFRSVDLQVHHFFDPSGYPAFDPVARRGWRGPYLQNARSVSNTNPARQGLFPAAEERRFNGDLTFQQRNFFHDASSSYYGEAGDRAVADPWGNPFIVQVPPASSFTGSSDDARRFRYARIVSAGPDGIIATPRDRLAGMEPAGIATARGDDLVLFLHRADIHENEEP